MHTLGSIWSKNYLSASEQTSYFKQGQEDLYGHPENRSVQNPQWLFLGPEVEWFRHCESQFDKNYGKNDIHNAMVSHNVCPGPEDIKSVAKKNKKIFNSFLNHFKFSWEPKMQASRPQALLAPLATWPRSAVAPSVRITILAGHSLSSDQMQLFCRMQFKQLYLQNAWAHMFSRMWQLYGRHLCQYSDGDSWGNYGRGLKLVFVKIE